MRLNQFLARAGFGSRRACEELIREGAVTINGHRLRELATRVEAGDNVLVNGKPVKLPLPIVAILHKPPGFLCTSPDSTNERTIYDLLPTGWPRVVYVGRLDKDSEGLLVVTNDGNLAQRLTHGLKGLHGDAFPEVIQLHSSNDVRLFADGVQVHLQCRQAV